MLMETHNASNKTGTLGNGTTTQITPRPGRDAGLISGTRVETAAGWRPVELLRVGDQVQTLDGGLRQVRRVERAYYGTDHGGYVLDRVMRVPGGAIGNCDAMFLMPEQHLMIESRVAEDLLGTPMVLLPASALEGYRGISGMAAGALIEAITLGFDDEEIVYANSGVLMQCSATVGSEFFTALDHGRGKALVSLLGRDARVLEQAIAKMNAETPEMLAA